MDAPQQQQQQQQWVPIQQYGSSGLAWTGAAMQHVRTRSSPVKMLSGGDATTTAGTAPPPLPPQKKSPSAAPPAFADFSRTKLDVHQQDLLVARNSMRRDADAGISPISTVAAIASTGPTPR